MNAEAAIQGATIEYRDPDSKAVAKYTYLDEKGNFCKQVQRFIDEETGKKRFVQWRSGRNGKRRYKDCPTMVYNLHLFPTAGTVCITEGEKDADTVNELNLQGALGHLDVVATTTGGATSWQDVFADKLVGKRVIILPDADAEGARYASDIEASLDVRGIKYRKVDFSVDGVKDVSEYLEAGYTTEQLVRKLGQDWILFPGESREQRENRGIVLQPI